MSESLDFRGYFHMDELVRKTARELQRLGYDVSAPAPAVLKTSIGTKVGTWAADIAGTRHVSIQDAGYVKRVIGQWPFNAVITGTITIAFKGEGYEDFRRQQGIPFFTTATATISRYASAILDYRTLEVSRIQSLMRLPHFYNPAYYEATQSMTTEVGGTASKLAQMMAGSSFSMECPYCKSMFVGGGKCPYCGAPVSTPAGGIVVDRVSERRA